MTEKITKNKSQFQLLECIEKCKLQATIIAKIALSDGEVTLTEEERHIITQLLDKSIRELT